MPTIEFRAPLEQPTALHAFRRDFRLLTGDPLILRVVVLDEDGGDPADLTPYTAALSMWMDDDENPLRRTWLNAPAAPEWRSRVLPGIITDPTAGRVEFTLTSDAMLGLYPGRFRYEISLIGAGRTSICGGVMEIQGRPAYSGSGLPPAQNTIAIGSVTVSIPADPGPPPEPEVFPQMGISPLALDFGSVVVGQSKDAILTLANSGTLPVVLSGVAIGSPFVWNFTGPGAPSSLPATIPVGGSVQLQFWFEPAAAGTASANVILSSNAQGSPRTIPIQGLGASDTPPVGMQWLRANGSQLVTEDGIPFRLRGVNWYGMESILIPGDLWVRGYRTVEIAGQPEIGILDQMAGMGFNAIRIPLCQDVTWPGRTVTAGNTISGIRNPDFLLSDPEAFPQVFIPAIEILDKIIAHAKSLGMRVMLDMHCHAPNSDNAAGTGGKWYTTSTPGAAGGTTGAVGEPRNEAQWIAAMVFLADRYKNEPAVCAIDLLNEPYELTWDDNPLTGWPAAAERAATAIQAVNPKIMIVVEGIHGEVFEFFWGIWGQNLRGVATRPVSIPIQNKLAYSPHEYATVGAGSGPGYLTDPRFPGILDMAGGVWDSAYGFIARQNIAPLIVGEVGGRFNPEDTINNAWIARFNTYGRELKISWFYWTMNGSDGDLPGVLRNDKVTPTPNTLLVLNDLLEGE